MREACIGADRSDRLIRGNLPQQFCSMGASPIRLPVTSMARISSVRASTSRWNLRHWWRLERPCLRAPLTITHGLDASAVYQQVQRPRTSLAGNFHEQGLLPADQCAEVRHRPIEPGHLQQARNHAGGLAQRQLEQRLQRQAGLDRGIREDGLAPALTGGRRQPLHPGIKPDLKRASLCQRCLAGFPVRRALACAGRLAHRRPLTTWIHYRNPSVTYATKPNQTTACNSGGSAHSGERCVQTFAKPRQSKPIQYHQRR